MRMYSRIYYQLSLKYKMKSRKEQMENFLFQENSGMNIQRKNINELYQRIQKQYKEIRLHKLWSTRIGEYVPRYLTAVTDVRKNAQKGILDVFVLTDCINHNSRLSEIIGRNIHIIDSNNAYIWGYVLRHFPKVEFYKYWNDYSERNKDKWLIPSNTMRYFKLTEKEEKEGKIKKELMGLQETYVCIQSRDAAYLSTIEPTVDYHYHDYKDSDINRLNLSADYLLSKEIVTVRMGRYVQGKAMFNNCIDYANEYYDELMDIVLMRSCKFFVGDICGICVLPMALNSPVALKNVAPVFDDFWGTFPQNPQNLFICKKYYSKYENRFLSFREMMRVERAIRGKKRGIEYVKLGIELIENSAEEILDLVKEMNERIDGDWIETEEDIWLQEKYQSLLKKWCKQKDIKANAVFHGKVGAVFLRNNQFLLE